MNTFPERGKINLICEKILDFLKPLPYILPEILFDIPFSFRKTIDPFRQEYSNI
jgi:hypothetical protein